MEESKSKKFKTGSSIIEVLASMVVFSILFVISSQFIDLSIQQMVSRNDSLILRKVITEIYTLSKHHEFKEGEFKEKIGSFNFPPIIKLITLKKSSFSLPFSYQELQFEALHRNGKKTQWILYQ